MIFSTKVLKKCTVIPKLLLVAISINDLFTSYLTSNNGVSEGDNLTPILFNACINDLIAEIKKLNLGVQVGYSKLNILVYADDIVLMADSKIEF